MKALKNKLNISKDVNKFTATVLKETEFTHFEDQIPKRIGWNYQGDTVYLPKTKEGFKYLLVITDLANRTFDVEPMTDIKDEDALSAYKRMLRRNFIKIPEYQLATDLGNEFKGSFNEFLEKHNIYHKVSRAGRHKQQGPVENLIKTISGLLFAYMNEKEKETGKVYREWTDKIHVVRTDLNKIRKKLLSTSKTDVIKTFNNLDDKGNIIKSKFKVGDMVYIKNEKPKDSFGHNQPTQNFRVGDYRWDKTPREIKELKYYIGDVPYRYIVEGFPNVSFTEKEMKKV
jgi:hypothetical protein